VGGRSWASSTGSGVGDVVRATYPPAIGCPSCGHKIKRHCSSATCNWYLCKECPLMVATHYQAISKGGIGNAPIAAGKLYVRKKVPWPQLGS